MRASRGQFTYEDHGTPWSTVARNLDVTVTRPASEYRGQAQFSNGTVTIQNYVPMRADMSTSFRIVDGQILLDRIDLVTDGARTQLTGVVDAGHWPEQIYQIKSKIDFPTEKGIWFAHDTFTVAGTGDFTGTFHLFKEQLANGRTRTGRELKGTFVSALAGVNAYRFSNLRGAVRWVPETLEVTDATAGVYGGNAKFSYTMAPIGVAGMPAVGHVRRAIRERRSHRVHELPRGQGHPAGRARDRAGTCSSGRSASTRSIPATARFTSTRRPAPR